MLLLYCFPSASVRRLLPPVAQSYLRTFWEQDWKLFAPNPLNHQERLLVRCVHPNGVHGAWQDPEAATVRTKFRFYFSYGSRVEQLHHTLATSVSTVYWHRVAECQRRLAPEHRGATDACTATPGHVLMAGHPLIKTIARLATDVCIAPAHQQRALATEVALVRLTSPLAPIASTKSPPPPLDLSYTTVYRSSDSHGCVAPF
jgi:hypothetical protein